MKSLFLFTVLALWILPALASDTKVRAVVPGTPWTIEAIAHENSQSSQPTKKFTRNRLYTLSVTFTSKGDIATCPDGIEFDAVMPVHYHGMPTEPRIEKTQANGCAYVVRGISFQMSGEWHLHFDVKQGNIFTRISTVANIR